MVLGVDYKQTISEVDPTLEDSRVLKNISKDMIFKLSAMINRLEELKKQRLLRVSINVNLIVPNHIFVSLLMLFFLLFSFKILQLP